MSSLFLSLDDFPDIVPLEDTLVLLRNDTTNKEALRKLLDARLICLYILCLTLICNLMFLSDGSF